MLGKTQSISRGHHYGLQSFAKCDSMQNKEAMTQSENEDKDFKEWEVDEDNLHESLGSLLQIEENIESRYVYNKKAKEFMKKRKLKSRRDVGTERDSLHMNVETADCLFVENSDHQVVRVPTANDFSV